MKSLTQLTFGAKEQIKLLADLERLLSQGMSPQEISEDFSMYGASTEQSIGNDISDALEAGGNLSDGLVNWLPQIPMQAIKSGEISGDLSGACGAAQKMLSASSGSVGKLFKSLLEPLFTIVMTLGGIALLTQNLFPQLGDMVPRQRWPAISSLVESIGTHFYNNGLVYLVIVVVVPMILVISAQVVTGKTRLVLDKLPFYKQYTMLASMQMLTSLGHLSGSGLSLDEAIEQVETTASKYLKWHAQQISENITLSQGQGNIGELLSTGLLNDRVVSRLKRINAKMRTDELLILASDEHAVIFAEQTAKAIFIFQSIAKIVAYGLMFMTFGGLMLLIMQITQGI